MTLYVYDPNTRFIIATFEGESNSACEIAAQDYADTDRFAWTYTPAFGAVDGLKWFAPQDMFGSHLANIAAKFGATEVEHLGGHRYIARRPDGTELRMITDEGIGTVEGEEGFDQAWKEQTK